MKRFKKFGAIIFLSAYLFIGFGLALPSRSLAADPQFTPQIGIPGSEFQQKVGVPIGKPGTNAVTGEAVMRSDLLARYIAAFYNWGFGIVGVVAVLMLMAAGVIWLTSGGDSGKIGNAKTMIEGALMGTGLLVGSWFLLNTINPNLTNLPALEMVVIQKVVTGCCEESTGNKMVAKKECKGTFYEDKKLNSNLQCEKELCCISNFSISGSNFNYCFLSFSSNCSGQKIQKSCSEVSECQGVNSKPLSCAGVDNGGVATGYIKESLYPFYCYNETVYPYTAEYGEPCGKKGDNAYGVCIKESETCSDENDFGGRFCNKKNSLKCCLDSGIW